MKTELDEFTYYYLLIESVIYKDKELFIFLNQAGVSTEQEDLEINGVKAINNVRSIEVYDETLGYVIHFENVHMYQVIDESSDLSDNDETETEGNITKFKASSLLNYAKNKTCLFDVTHGTIEHYRVITGDEWIHVLCSGKPTVTQKSEWLEKHKNT